MSVQHLELLKLVYAEKFIFHSLEINCAQTALLFTPGYNLEVPWSMSDYACQELVSNY